MRLINKGSSESNRTRRRGRSGFNRKQARPARHRAQEPNLDASHRFRLSNSRPPFSLSRIARRSSLSIVFQPYAPFEATQANPVFGSAHVGGCMRGLRRSGVWALRNTAHSRAQKAIQRRHSRKTFNLAIIGKIGEAIRAVDGRTAICNMSIEGGAPAGTAAPDDHVRLSRGAPRFVPRRGVAGSS